VSISPFTTFRRLTAHTRLTFLFLQSGERQEVRHRGFYEGTAGRTRGDVGDRPRRGFGLDGGRLDGQSQRGGEREDSGGAVGRGGTVVPAYSHAGAA
jgi:hypothetical protein